MTYKLPCLFSAFFGEKIEVFPANIISELEALLIQNEAYSFLASHEIIVGA